MHIGISGYGKMGRAVERVALSRGHTCIMVHPDEVAPDELRGVDCIIDFTHADVALSVVKRCIDAGVPVVSGTTGWDAGLQEARAYCSKHDGTMLWAPNFSIGMHITFALNKVLAGMMDKSPEYSVHLYEAHHTEKKDKPSGTAIALAKQIVARINRVKSWKLDSRDGETQFTELPIQADRIADVKGIHEVTYTGPNDRISIRHEAFSRDGFAWGAVVAAEWLSGRKGAFSFEEAMSEILG